MNTYYIYALIDPTDNEVRYVGCSKNPAARLQQHLTYGRNDDYKMCTGGWVRGLIAVGLRPRMVILEEYATKWRSYVLDAEKQWQQHYLEKGAKLLNRHTRKPGHKSSRVLPGREPTLDHTRERGFFYTFDY